MSNYDPEALDALITHMHSSLWHKPSLKGTGPLLAAAFERWSQEVFDEEDQAVRAPKPSSLTPKKAYQIVKEAGSLRKGASASGYARSTLQRFAAQNKEEVCQQETEERPGNETQPESSKQQPAELVTLSLRRLLPQRAGLGSTTVLASISSSERAQTLSQVKLREGSFQRAFAVGSVKSGQ